MNNFIKLAGLFLTRLVGILIFVLVIYLMAGMNWIFTGILIGGVFIVFLLACTLEEIYEHFVNL
jgi:ABC-type bacteriocin/lantibiotic exporter with double-glycine peptidase domain